MDGVVDVLIGKILPVLSAVDRHEVSEIGHIVGDFDAVDAKITHQIDLPFDPARFAIVAAEIGQRNVGFLLLRIVPQPQDAGALNRRIEAQLCRLGYEVRIGDVIAGAVRSIAPAVERAADRFTLGLLAIEYNV